MNRISCILNIVLIISLIIVVYMIVSLFFKKTELKNKRIKQINNTKYIILTVIVLILFIVYGILRNFE